MAKRYHQWWTAEDIAAFWRLKDEGYTFTEIAEKIGFLYTLGDNESHQTMADMLEEAMKLQEKAEFQLSQVMVSVEDGVSVAQITGTADNGDSVQLIQIKKKNPLPFRATMQNEQGTSRVCS